jgi:hypothetical protein
MLTNGNSADSVVLEPEPGIDSMSASSGKLAAATDAWSSIQRESGSAPVAAISG